MLTPPRQRLPGELVFTLLLLLGSLYMLWQAYGISKFESITSAGMFPMLATLAMVVTALIFMRQTLHAPRESVTGAETLAQQFVRRLTPPALVGFTVAIAAYMMALEPLGFVVSSYLFMVVGMRLLGGPRWLLNMAVSAVCLAAIYLVFQTAFSVVLPKGTLLQPLFSMAKGS